MEIGEYIKKLRNKNGLLQKQVAAEVNMQASNYSKIENGKREPSIQVLKKLAELFGVSIDDIVYTNGKVPENVNFQDKTAQQQLRLLQKLDQEDREVVFKIIETMLTKKEFKEFFEQKLAS